MKYPSKGALLTLPLSDIAVSIIFDPNPIRLQRRRTKGFSLQAASMTINGLQAVCVSRPSILGNPFNVEEFGRDLAIGLHGAWLDGGLKVLGEQSQNALIQFNGDGERGRYREFDGIDIRAWHLVVQEIATHKLRGKNIACWCRTDQACHGDNLLRWARC